MKNHASILIAAGMALAAVAAPAAAQDGGSVIVYRGAQAQIVRFDNSGGVTVARGEPAAPPAQMIAPLTTFESGGTFAGDILWVVDRANERLTACELYYTTNVDGRRIRCIERALPFALR